MLIFIIALGAGFATPHAEPHVAKLLKSATLDGVSTTEGELRCLTFILLMLVVSLLALGTHASALTVILGGALGLFGPRLFKAAQKRFTS